MSENENSRLMVLFVGGLFVVTIAMIVVIFVATRRPVVMVLPQQGGTGAAATGGPASTSPAAAAAAPVPIPEIAVVRLGQAPAGDDPFDPAWNQIATTEVPLEKQLSTEPMLGEQTIDKIMVQAARDSSRFVWRLSWPQAEPVYRSNVGEFSDAVALQFPMKDGAPYTMGGPDMPVTMLYWKALWQKDIDDGFQDVTDIYPNSWNDFYWFADGTGPQPVSTAFEGKGAGQYLAGRTTGNPMSNTNRSQPVEELTAHGFGSSTHISESTCRGRGVWQDGHWYVVIERPATGSDPLLDRFAENPEQQMIAIAVWDGTALNRGGRKHITNWLPMRIEQ